MKKIASVILLISVLFTCVLANIVYAQDTNNADKLICKATMSDHFTDDCVVVVINKRNSKINKFFSKEKFKGVDLTSVEDMTYIEGDPDTKIYLDQDNFRQVLKLSLVKKERRKC